MRALKIVATVTALAGFVAASPAGAANPNGPSTTWNNSKYIRYDASALGRPPGGVTHRVSVRTADLSRLPRIGDPESYVLDDADFRFDPPSLFPAGSTLYSIGSDQTTAVGSNERGTIWDATASIYARNGSGGGKVCRFRATVTPTLEDGQPSVSVDGISGPVCSTY